MYPFLCLFSIGAVAINSITHAKYYTSIVTQVWKTNFTYYGVIEKLQSTLTLNGYNLKDNGEYYVIN